MKPVLAGMKALLFCVTALVLSACNGTSGENGDDPFGSGTVNSPAQIEVFVLDEACQNQVVRTEIGSTLCIQARLSDSDSSVANQSISFTSTLGELEVASRLTDTSGIANVALSSTTANIGAGQVSVSYTASGQSAVTADANFEFLVNQTNGASAPPSLVLSVSDTAGQPSNRVRVGSTLSLSALLLDGAGEPLANQIVAFQSPLGTFAPQTALTQADGVASSVFTPDDNLGAGSISITTTIGDVIASSSQNIEVLAADATQEDTIRIGVFENGEFNEGILGVDGAAADADVAISAGGTIGLNVSLVDSTDTPIQTNLPVTFSSICVSSQDASIDETVLAISGTARSTFQDLSCAGANGSNDVISASITVNGVQTSVSRVINLQAEAVGAISFVDATPNNIVLAGSGGQDASTVSTVTFQVNGALGNPLAQQTVSFSLNSDIGGLALSPQQGLTNSEGQVSTRVTAGNVPTSVRVTAQVNSAEGTSLQTQSELLTVNTGLPDQNSIGLAASNPNPEAFNRFGQTVTVTARLADSFNNPVPNGTAVSFVTEGGSIEPSCTTINGTCSVTWTSSQPRIESDHRVTILATAIGHETLADSNGDNQYSVEDGAPITSDNGSGFQTVIPTTTGFIDLPEAWLDSDENGVQNGAEPFLDFNNSGTYDTANDGFDGPQCASGCANNSLHVRRSIVLVTSSSGALLTLFAEGDELSNNLNPATGTVASLARGDSITLTLQYTDTAGQPIASGSSIEFTSSAGVLSGNTVSVMPQTTNATPRVQSVTLTNSLLPDETTIDATVNATVTSPSGVVSTLSVLIRLD